MCVGGGWGVEAWTWGKVQGDKNMLSDKFDYWEDEGSSPKKLCRTPVGVELAIAAAHWLALGFTAIHRTLCPEQIFLYIFLNLFSFN